MLLISTCEGGRISERQWDDGCRTGHESFVPSDADFAPAQACGPRLIIECHGCAYEPSCQDVKPRGRCPKCGNFSWQRVWQPRQSLAAVPS
jgi:hypothetical protein